MRETPPVEGKFFCVHVARDVCDLVEIAVRKRRFYKIALFRVTGARHRSAQRLLEYYSCKKCFTSVVEKAAGPKNAEGGAGHGYKVTWSGMRYAERMHLRAKYVPGRGAVASWNGLTLGSYHAVRDGVGSTLGSGYDIDARGAGAAWRRALGLALDEYGRMARMRRPGKWGAGRPLDENWLSGQKRPVRILLTRMAKAKLASLDYGESPKFHRAFGTFPSIAGGRKCAGCGVYLERRAKDRCRFCRKPRKSRYVAVPKAARRMAARTAGAEGRKERRAERFESEGERTVISESVEAKGIRETASELSEDYGRPEALRMLRETGVGKDELEDYYEDMDPCEREGERPVASESVEAKGIRETASELIEDYGRPEALRMLRETGAGKDELEDYYEDMDPCEREESERDSR